jgi:hypothetical protein
MNKRVLLLTGTTDILRKPNETDNTMEEVFDLTLPSKQRYVKKHGYDLLSLRSFGKDTHNRFTELDLGFLRVLRTFEMLEYYDAVMWIDADSIITNDNFCIDDFQLDDDHCFYASWDWSGKRTFSTGNFIIQRGKNLNELFNAFLQVGRHVIDTNQWGWEQTTMNLIYNNTNLKNTIKILDHNFLGSIPNKKLFMGIWDGRSETPYPWSVDSFLAHITGIPNKNRIQVLTQSFRNYL